MTATLQPETKATSRRALLAGALGGVGAMAAAALGRPGAIRAVDGGTALLGTANTSTAVTSFEASGAGVVSLKGIHAGAGTGVQGSSNTGKGVYGYSNGDVGVEGYSAAYIGVRGQSGSNIGVRGSSSSTYGVYGVSSATDQAAILAASTGNSTGLFGLSGVGPLTPTKAKTGVYGYANQDSTAKGIVGQSSKGFAGYFLGKVYTSKFHELKEISTPAAPGANKARLFVRDNGSGKTQLCVRFNTGAVKVLATQP